jgi:hypothetical protein
MMMAAPLKAQGQYSSRERAAKGVRRRWKEEKTYKHRPPVKVHTKATNHPCVVSPLTASHPKTRSSPNGRPATSEVKSVRRMAAE